MKDGTERSVLEHACRCGFQQAPLHQLQTLLEAEFRVKPDKHAKRTDILVTLAAKILDGGDEVAAAIEAAFPNEDDIDDLLLTEEVIEPLLDDSDKAIMRSYKAAAADKAKVAEELAATLQKARA